MNLHTGPQTAVQYNIQLDETNDAMHEVWLSFASVHENMHILSRIETHVTEFEPIHSAPLH